MKSEAIPPSSHLLFVNPMLRVQQVTCIDISRGISSINLIRITHSFFRCLAGDFPTELNQCIWLFVTVICGPLP